ncbi:hypothetical protein PL78_09990 [Yersinia entomophaga]|uniref:Secreted protein n=1 Tax=Yersinia entomophaga TaxID=935293 RepID=A0ABM6BKU6_YERET|nr:hypothetical protein PL78_09990 [Yersinia entomophaga]
MRGESTTAIYILTLVITFLRLLTQVTARPSMCSGLTKRAMHHARIPSSLCLCKYDNTRNAQKLALSE